MRSLAHWQVSKNYRKYKGEELMQSALRIETKVLPGNRIEINLPSEAVPDSVGQTIEVIIILPEKPKLMRQNILE